MTIKVGDAIPSVKLKRMGASGMEEVDTADLFKGRKVVMFAVPGAFTPTCSARHMPSYLDNIDALAAKGVDAVICMAVNDPFVMKAWGDHTQATGKVEMLPDGNAALTSALGLGMDGSGFGLGQRSQRFALVAEDGIVKHLAVEAGGKFEVSGGDKILAVL